jgi:LPS-assembly protein
LSRLSPAWAGLLLAWACASSAAAQGVPAQPINNTTPVTFTADSVSYDRDAAIVTATGHVEAWQNDHILRADKITFDRNTNVTAATGNVVMLEPDGEVLFADYAELTQGMRDGVLKGMRAILEQNGRLAANGGRRTAGRSGGEINELSRAVYSTCNLCARDPTKPPLWQLRAYSAIQDVEHKRIEYQDVLLEAYGIPVLYLPYLSHPDPSAKRQSGLLVPSFGNSTHLGQFLAVPYYWAINDQSDATIVPLINSRAGPQVLTDYRLRLNSGTVTVNTSAAYDENAFQGHLFAKGTFSYNDTWRYGFDVNVATSSTYLSNYHIAPVGAANVLTSRVYAEGFGQGAYALLDARAYQGLTSAVSDAKLPFVLPRYQYSYFGEPDAWGGRLSVDTGMFNIVRGQGTNDQRASFSANWDRPWTGQYGDLWKLSLHLDSEVYNATNLDLQPNYSTASSDSRVNALPTAAVEVRLPLLRDAGANATHDWGTQVVEPIVQLITAPVTGLHGYRNLPDEDSLGMQFDDTNLFSLNRFPGIDRLEGGERANVGIHTLWTVDGNRIDSLIGESYRVQSDPAFDVNSGLHGHLSDIVARTTWTPTSWLDLTGRARVDHQNFDIHYAEGLASFGFPALRFSTGYLYTADTPYYELDPPPPAISPTTPRNEVSASMSTNYGDWRFAAIGRRDLQTNQMVSLGSDAAYEDECFIFEVKYLRRYTSLNGDHGSTTLLFQITLKSVGQFGFHGL